MALLDNRDPSSESRRPSVLLCLSLQAPWPDLPANVMRFLGGDSQDDGVCLHRMGERAL